MIAASVIWLVVHSGEQNPSGIESITNVKESPVEDQITEDKGLKSKLSSDKSMDKSLDMSPGKSMVEKQEDYNQPTIKVLLSESQKVETVSLEDYVRGVVAAEMPLNFEQAALEAQALAARTYMIRRLWMGDRTGITNTKADVTDTQTHQVYRSLEKMKQLKKDNAVGWNKVNEAVSRTYGEVIVYKNQPIEALYFSTSNGYTENSSEVFPNSLPYLRSVDSPWDKKNSPRAQETVKMRLSDFFDKLGVKEVTASDALSKQLSPRIIEWTEGKRVKQVEVGKKRFSGEEVRHLLGLRSAAFEWMISGNGITLTTYGSGHGVGMSQWGANGMAEAGKTARQIVEHYYSGTHIEKVSKLVNDAGKRL